MDSSSTFPTASQADSDVVVRAGLAKTVKALVRNTSAGAFRKPLIAFVLIAPASLANAEINRCVKQDGGLLLTDEPCSGGARSIASAEEADMQPHFFNAREVPSRPKPIQRNLTATYTNPAIPALTRP